MGIMSGVRVLEVAAWTYVPVAGAILAEWGADVIKVEHPEEGDPQRGLVTSGLVPAEPSGVNHMIELPNRGKRSVGLDLRTPEGRDLLLRLARTSDVFVTNVLPPARRKLGIELEDLRGANADIIYVRGSGHGQRGAEADRGGYDGCSFWARSGAADIATRNEGEWPVGQAGPAYGDLIGGLAIAGGVSAALYHRLRTGEALVVDNSLLATGMWATSASIMAADLFGPTSVAFDRLEAPNPIVNTYRSSDGRFLSLIMLQSDRYWAELVAKMGRPELADDPRYVDAQARAENRRECIQTLDEIFATRTFAEWKALLLEVEGVWAPVQTAAEVLDDPQAEANGYIRTVTNGAGGTFRMVSSPLQFNETAPELTPAPDLGEHTDEILQDILDLEMDAIIDLKLKGVIT